MGKYWCEQCGHEWTSAWAWKDEEQKCSRCREWTAPWALKLVVHEVGAKVKVRKSDLGVVFSIRTLAWAGTPPVYDVELVDGARVAVPHDDIEILGSVPERTNHRSDMCTLCLKLQPEPCSSVLLTGGPACRPVIQGIERGKRVTDMTPYRKKRISPEREPSPPFRGKRLHSEREASKELSLDRWFEEGRNDVDLWLEGLHDRRREKDRERARSKKKKKERAEDGSRVRRKR